MIQDNNKVERVILQEESSGGNNYEKWSAGLKADEITTFQGNAIYLQDPSQREIWMQQVFEDPAPKKVAFSFNSPTKYGMERSNTSPYQTPTKGNAVLLHHNNISISAIQSTYGKHL